MQTALIGMQAREQALIKDFAFFDHWEDRYAYVLELGRALDFDAQWRDVQYLVEGCQSRVWVHTSLEDGIFIIKADSDSSLVRGLLAIIVRIYGHVPPEAVLLHPFTCFKALGLGTHLTPARNNGVMAVHKALCQAAKAVI